MEKSPYDSSIEDAFYRNQRRLEEELTSYEKNIALIDALLAHLGIEKEELVEPVMEKKKSSRPPRRRGSKSDWIKI